MIKEITISQPIYTKDGGIINVEVREKEVKTEDLIRLFENAHNLPRIYEQIKDLPTKTLSEQYGKITEVKIIGWALNCLLSYTLHQQGYSFREIQAIILNNTQSPFYISIETLWRESWIWENILSKASHFLKDPYLSKSWYKRMSQHKVPDPIKELEYIALRKEEESVKHQKYSISRWEEERGFGKLQKGYVCDVCKEEVDKFKKVCYNCIKDLEEEEK